MLLNFIKVIFIFIGAVFVITLVSSEIGSIDFNTGGSSSSDNRTVVDSGDPVPRGTYVRSYDTNRDGTVSDAEYKQGELNRISEELERLEEEVQEALDAQNRSPYADMVSLSRGNARAKDGDEEYVILTTNSRNTASVNITEWKLKSLVSGRGDTIGTGVRYLPSGRSRDRGDIFLAPGDTAYVTTGSVAGINTSFLENMCIGYLGTDRFVPSTSRECPLLEDEDLDSFGLAFDDFRREREYDACMDEIESIGQCEIPEENDDLDDDCQDFIDEYATYSGCLRLHRYDADFYGNTWRIFLSARNDLWRYEREAIALIDENGKIVDVVRY